PEGKVYGSHPHLDAFDDPPKSLGFDYDFTVVSTGNYRVLFKLSNHTTRSVMVPVLTGTNLGSDAGTEVVSSADGNTTAGRNDTWILTKATSGAHPAAVLIARGNRNKVRRHGRTRWLVSSPALPGGGIPDELVDKRAITLRPGEEVYFLYFAHIYRADTLP